VKPPDQPLIVLVGPTASGKTSLALRLAQEFDGEIVSCDSVAVYREMEIGTAKPSREERALIQHHMIDIAWPDEACTAGDYSRQAREALTGITERGHVPIVAGGTGLYLRALIDGLFPAPPQKPGQRERLRKIASIGFSPASTPPPPPPSTPTTSPRSSVPSKYPSPLSLSRQTKEKPRSAPPDELR